MTQWEIYELLKANPGKEFTSKQIAKKTDTTDIPGKAKILERYNLIHLRETRNDTGNKQYVYWYNEHSEERVP